MQREAPGVRQRKITPLEQNASDASITSAGKQMYQHTKLPNLKCAPLCMPLYGQLSRWPPLLYAIFVRTISPSSYIMFTKLLFPL